MSRSGSRPKGGARDCVPSVAADDVAFWRPIARRGVDGCGTPLFLIAKERLAAQWRRLEEAFAGLPVRHWWSFKTLPLLPAVRWWRSRGGPVEVVSEFELQAVVALGVPAGEILVNGPAKHTWLPRHGAQGLRVNLDSVAEARVLVAWARTFGWRVGLRLNTGQEGNFEHPGVRTQFGLLPAEVGVVLGLLRRSRIEAEVLHLHLGTNVPEAARYRTAAREALAIAAQVGWEPAVLDLGGGFPAARVRARNGSPLDAGFSLASMRRVVTEVRSGHRYLREIWMENGRWLTAPAGVLAVSILDVKEGRGVRTLVCDGGRTLHAMVATWERHGVFPLAARRGGVVSTLVCGPTCMAFDNLGIHELPSRVKAGDVLVWLDAGAYSLSWETRFSHGLGAVAWAEGGRIDVVREREAFESWVEPR